MYILLFLFWLILNGRITLEIILFGLVISAFVYLFIYKFMDYRPTVEMAIFRCSSKLIKYGIFLMIEVIKANIQTAKIILDFEHEPKPLLLRFPTDYETDTAKTMLANSITLTPGTITVHIDDDLFLVHGLDESYLEGIDECEFITRIHDIEDTALGYTKTNSPVIRKAKKGPAKHEKRGRMKKQTTKKEERK